jgi:predicted permease
VSADIAARLAVVFALVAAGAWATRRGWIGLSAGAPGPHRVGRALGTLAFTVLLPALLFRTAARIDLPSMPWAVLAVYFGPTLLTMAAVIAWERRRSVEPAAPAVRGVAAVFGNSAQLGIPMITALHGERGLALHLALVSVHAIVLLVPATIVAEVARARAGPAPEASGWRPTLRLLGGIVRQSVIHPVVLPVLLGLAWNLAGGGLAAPVDQALHWAGWAALPLCLVLLGVSLAEGGAARLSDPGLRATVALKLLALPTIVWMVARVAGLHGTPLAVLVLAAALPSGVNALLFAQRYQTAVDRTAATVVASTLGYALTVPVWAWALAHLA